MRTLLLATLLAAYCCAAVALPADISVPLGAPGFDLVHDAARHRLYVSLPSLNQIAVVSTDTYTVVERVPIGSQPHGLDLSLDGTRLWVALFGAGAIVSLDLDTLAKTEIVVGDVMGDPRIWDVVEAKPNRVFVSANPGVEGGPRLAVVKVDQSNQVAVVAGNRIIRFQPEFARSSTGLVLFVGEQNQMYRLDLQQESAPVLQTSSSIAGVLPLIANPAGDRLYLGGGNVRGAGNFQLIASVGAGLHEFGADPGVVFVARPPATLETWDTTAFTLTGTEALPCSFTEMKRLILLPGDAGTLVLGDDEVCGSIEVSPCSAVPVIDPEPQPGETAVAPGVVLRWTDGGSACPTRYDVQLDTADPPVTTVCDDVAEDRCDPGSLDPETTYHWRVVASNAAGTTPGPVWSFTTGPDTTPVTTDLVLDFAENAYDMAYDDARDRLYVSLPDSHEIAVVSTESYTVVDRVAIGARPLGIDLSLDGERLWVALNEGAAVAALDLDTLLASEIVVGDATKSNRTFDVAEGGASRIFVSADFLSTATRLAMIETDQGNQVVTLPHWISAAPIFERSPDGQFLYIGETGNVPNSLYKLDLLQESVPIVLEDDHGSIIDGGGAHLEVSLDGTRIYLGSGQVFRTESFVQAGLIESGVPQFGDDPGIVYVARQQGTIEIWETANFTPVHDMALPCSFSDIRRLIVLPDDRGWLVLGDGRLCGLLATPTCDAPSAADLPSPEDGAAPTTLSQTLSWTGGESTCPTTFDVLFGEVDPPSDVLCEDLSATTCDSGPLDPETTYYWQVRATNAAGETPGPVWSFTTGAAPPALTHLAVPLPGYGAALALDAARNRLYVSIPDENEITVISTETYTVVDHVPIGSQPQGIDLALDSESLWVALNGAATVAQLDLDTMQATELLVGDIVGDSRIWDAMEGKPDRVFVAANPGDSDFFGSSKIGMIKADQGGATVTVAGNRIIGSAPAFARSPDHGYLYIGDSASSESPVFNSTVFKLDITTDAGPIVDSAHLELGAQRVEVDPTGSRVFAGGGEVLRADTLLQAGRVAEGVHRFDGDDADLVHVAQWGAIDFWETQNLTRVDGVLVPCASGGVNDLVVLPDHAGWLVLVDDRVCAVLAEADCEGAPPAPMEPVPGDGATDVAPSSDAAWSVLDMGCPTTFAVLLDDENPPTTEVCEALSASECALADLNDDTTYYWQVVATNGAGSTPGPIWSFTTGSVAAFDEITLDLGGEGFDMDYDTARERLYVSVPSRNEIVAISTETRAIVDRIPIGSRPHGVDVTLDGERLLVALNGAAAIATLDLDTLQSEETVVATVTDHSETWDVVEGVPDRVFVSADEASFGNGRIAMIDVSQDSIAPVASNAQIELEPTLERSRDGLKLYIGEQTAVFVLDLTQQNAPLVHSAPFDELVGHLAVGPDPGRLYFQNGNVVRTDTFLLAGVVGPGVSQLGDDPGIVYVARDDGELESWDTASFTKIASRALPCGGSDVRQLVVLPEQRGWMVLVGDQVCGLIVPAGCTEAPPPPVDPTPVNGASGLPLELAFSWGGAGECATTYEVRLDTVDPPAAVLCGDRTETSCVSPALLPATTYYWRVVAGNAMGDTTGPVWSFTTAAVVEYDEVVIELRAPGFDMDYDEVRQRLYVSVPDRNELVAISTELNAAVDRIPIGSLPQGLDVTLDGERLLVALGGAAAVTTVDLDTWQQVETVVGGTLENSRTFDVVEAKPNRIFVSANPGSGGSARIGVLRVDQGNAMATVADNANIRNRPVLEGSLDGQFLYIGEPSRLYKLDITQESGPIVLDNSPGPFQPGTHHLEVGPDPGRLYLGSGRVVRTDSFFLAGVLDEGISQFGDDPATVYVARPDGLLETWDTTKFVRTESRPMPCTWNQIEHLVVLPDERGWLVLGEDRVCGLVARDTCGETPPVPAAPMPADGSDDVAHLDELQWMAAGSCPTTYDVLLDATNPPSTVVCDDVAENGCVPELSPATTYYWQVVAQNATGPTPGPVWSFTTRAAVELEPIDIELGGLGFDMESDVSRHRLYVSLPSSNEIAAISTETYTIIDRMPMGPQPHGLDLTEDGERLLVALHGAGAIKTLDLTTLQSTETVVGAATENNKTWDVVEGNPDRILVTASSSAFARVAMIKVDEGGEAVTVADGEIIRTEPALERSPDGAFVYVGAGSFPNSLYKLDLSQDAAPIVLEDQHGQVHGTDHLETNSQGTRIYTGNGEVLRTESFLLGGVVAGGVAQFGDSAEVVHIASEPSSIETWETANYTKVDHASLPCDLDDIKRLIVLPGGAGRLVLGDDRVCGLVAMATCGEAPPASENPQPASGAAAVPLAVDLAWSGGGSCPTTYDVAVDVVDPPATVVCTDLEENRCTLTSLLPSTTYFWRVTATNEQGETPGPVWSFATQPLPPPEEPLVVTLPAAGHDMALDAARGLLYVSLPSLGEIAVISTETFTLRESIPMAPSPRGIDVSLDGERLWVALEGAGKVSSLALDSLQATQYMVGAANDSLATWDVIEAKPGRVLVGANPGSAEARVAMILVDADQVEVAAGARDLSGPVRLARGSDGQFAFVGVDDGGLDHLFKLDLGPDDAPVVLESPFNTVDGAEDLGIDPLGQTVFLSSGQVVRTNSFLDAAAVSAGVHRFGADAGTFYVARAPSTLETWERENFDLVDSAILPCSVSSVRQLIVLPNDAGVVILGDNKVCGLALDTDQDGMLVGDNCPTLANADQADYDGDGFGDACDGPCSLDLDGDSSASPLTDGILALRDMFGFTGYGLTAGALPPDALRDDPAKLSAHLEGCGGEMLDIDGNGEIRALTDGVLFMRYLFGFRGQTLIDNAVGGGCERCSPAEIETYLIGFAGP